MENPTEKVEEEPLFEQERHEAPEELSPLGPLAEVGTTLDELLTQPESRGWLIASLVLALFLYLVTWFLNDAWDFAATKWAEVSGQAATTTVTPSLVPSLSSTVPISPTVSLTSISPILTFTPTVPLTPDLLSPTPEVPTLSSSSPPALFCVGMGCGAAIVLAIVLIVSWRVRRPHP